MARPPAKELTDRELEIMHVYWGRPAATTQEVRDILAEQGNDLAYTTVATLVRILTDKGFLQQINSERPFRYQATQAYKEVSRRLLDDLVDKVFHGSRKQLLLHLVDEKPLSPKERAVIAKLMEELES
jgi:BlaI family transcriptional regulator, penicillinase repressor